jgi:hypothetical protein
LLTQRQLLELLKTEALSQAVDGRISQDQAIDFGTERGHGGCIASALVFGREGRTLIHRFKNPGISSAVMEKTREVIAFVHELKDGGEDLCFFVGEEDAAR